MPAADGWKPSPSNKEIEGASARTAPPHLPSPRRAMLGVNLGGKPEAVTIEFQPEAAPYVAEREYHVSQSLETRADGCLVLKMRVAVDCSSESRWRTNRNPLL